MKQGQNGLSLVELMVSLALGLLIVAGVTTVFVNTSSSMRVIENAARQVENARYAMQLLSEDIEMAGYLSEFDVSTLDLPVALPDACSTTQADLIAALPLATQGYDDDDGDLSCLSDVKEDTDVLVIRRTASCVAGTTGCSAVAVNSYYFQASRCSTSLSELGGPVAGHFALDSDTTSADSSTLADLRKLYVRIYFIANNDVSGDGIPTLKRWELGSGVSSLVQGIENLQLEYGIDSDGDGAPDDSDSYTADPNSFDADGDAGTDDSIANWANVVAIKLHLLARSINASAGYTDEKTYQLGTTSVEPFDDAYRRNVYNSVAVLKNVAGRRER
jgi:type IV pilus assembly protein PilW